MENSSDFCEVKDSKFSIVLPPIEKGGPYTLRIVAGDELKDDKVSEEEVKEINDVISGEVWVACGQSNMEFELQNTYDGQNIVKNLSNDRVRFFYVPKMAYECEELDKQKKNAEWNIMNSQKDDPAKIGRISAVAYYFADKISRELDVCVGIINANWGGTHAYCWMGREALESNANTAYFMKEYDDIVKDQDPDEYDKEYEDYLVYQAGFDKRCGEYYATHEHPSWDECIELCGENKYPGPIGPKAFVRPTGLYEVMLKQFIPYTCKGFIYYQGEEDDQTPEKYYDLMTTLIRQWRDDWKDDEMPVYLVQLPMFKNESDADCKNWPLIREAQERVAKTIKNVEAAIITDMGVINDIHPTHKEKVGERLALKALMNTYKKIGFN